MKRLDVKINTGGDFKFVYEPFGVSEKRFDELTGELEHRIKETAKTEGISLSKATVLAVALAEEMECTDTEYIMLVVWAGREMGIQHVLHKHPLAKMLRE